MSEIDQFVEKYSLLGTRIDKPWGAEFLIEHNERYLVKTLLMRDGHRCSLQRHHRKHETVIVLKGAIYVHLEDSEVHLNEGDRIVLTPGMIHRMEARGADCLYLECSTPELDDVERLEDDYKRI